MVLGYSIKKAGAVCLRKSLNLFFCKHDYKLIRTIHDDHDDHDDHD